MNSASEILRSLGERLQGGASVKNVFGDPITVDGKTVIPVARVRYGFGGGGGRHGEAEEDEHHPHQGWGGGGGVRADPAGVLEITATETRFIHFLDPGRIGLMVGAGFLLGMMCCARRRRRKG